MPLCKQRQNKLKIEEMLNIGEKWPTACYICPHITVGLFLRVSVVWVDECGFQQVRVSTRMATLFEHRHPQHRQRNLWLQVARQGKRREQHHRNIVYWGGIDIGVGIEVILWGTPLRNKLTVSGFRWPLWQMFTCIQCLCNQIKINLIRGCITHIGCCHMWTNDHFIGFHHQHNGALLQLHCVFM